MSVDFIDIAFVGKDANGDTADSSRSTRRRARPPTTSRWRPRQPQAPAAPGEPDYAAELAQLKNQGILTDEEFEAKKKQILGI